VDCESNVTKHDPPQIPFQTTDLMHCNTICMVYITSSDSCYGDMKDSLVVNAKWM